MYTIDDLVDFIISKLKKPKEGLRKFTIKNFLENKVHGFAGNTISTAKYRWWNFFVKNLIEQFLRLANVYFLLVSCLQVILPQLSPTGQFGTVIPLILVLAVTMVKDLYEDILRAYSDIKTNTSKSEVLIDGKFVKKKWSEIKVGQIVKINNNESFPGDIITLATSESQGLCYILTASLDGETNLKIRRALADTMDLTTDEQIKNIEGTIECEQPNPSLYTFEGNLIMNGQTYVISKDQILLRGSSLRNTKFIYGVVVYTGRETKLMMNSKKTPHKMSKVEGTVNYGILLIFCCQVIVVLACSTGNIIWTASSLKNHWYIGEAALNSEQLAEKFFGGLVTYFILFNNFIPISLYVSIEFAKVYQANVWINLDPKMYLDKKPEGKPANAKTSSLVEELGQVEYVFSDKTGTLTQNKMEFLKFSVAGVPFGKGTTEIAKAAAKRSGKEIIDDRPEGWKPEEDGWQFYDDAIQGGEWKKHKLSKELHEFFLLLGLCHTVIPETDKEDPSKIVLNASSPDEGALVKAGVKFGFDFYQRSPKTVTLKIDGKDHVWEVLAVLEFNSTRKRMSVIVKNDKGEIILYCKGADSIIWDECMKGDVKYKKETHECLKQFAADGLRTLLCGKRVLTQKEFDEWYVDFDKAKKSMDKNKEDIIMDVEAKIETNLELVGATAIEDKLQDGVPNTISTLASGGIKIWVLTGDKQETAINIGYACAMLDNSMHQMILNEEDFDKLQKITKQHYIETKEKVKKKTTQDFAVIVDGATLKHILDDKLISKHTKEGKEPLNITFLKLCMMCKSVVCCRVSPLQKSQVVLLVKNNLKGVVTLAIGDGANDVSMIQAAHIGVGISGEEGEQASRASDFAIAQFRFLQRLLLVHGRYSYRRVCKLILYSFYKNATLQFTQFWYVFFNSISGASLYDNTMYSLYNIVWTSLPVFGLAFFDKDVGPNESELFPELYTLGQKNYYFDVKIFISWMLRAAVHSLIIFFLPFFSYQFGMLDGGRNVTYRMLGSLLYTCVILVVTFKVGIEITNWNVFIFIFIFGTLIIYFAFIFIYHILGAFFIPVTADRIVEPFRAINNFLGLSTVLNNVYFEIYDMIKEPSVWVILFLVLVLCCIVDIVLKSLRRLFDTQLYHVLQDTKPEKRTRDYIGSIFPIHKMKAPVRTLGRKWADKDTKADHLELKDSKEIKDEEYTGYGFSELEIGKTELINEVTQERGVVKKTEETILLEESPKKKEEEKKEEIKEEKKEEKEEKKENEEKVDEKTKEGELIKFE